MSKHWTQTRKGRAKLSQLGKARWERRRIAKAIHDVDVVEAVPDPEVMGERVLSELWSRLTLVEKIEAIGAVLRRTQHA